MPQPPSKSSRSRALAGRAIAILLVIGVFVFVLPRVADYGEVWRIVSALTGTDIAELAAIAVINLTTFGPPWMAAFPGLSLLHSLVLSQASTAASSVLPGGDAVGIAMSYSMLRRWGFSVEQVTVGSAATTVWNAFANVAFAVAGAGLLALAGESNPLLTSAAVIGTIAIVVAIGMFASALHADGNARRVGRLAERLWNRIARLLRRRQAAGWDERLVGFRREAIGLLQRRWIALSASTLAGHLTVFLVLLAALRVVGVSSAEVSTAEVFAAWALIRVITTVPLTPGGVGVVELGLTGALVGFGGNHAEVVAAVLLYRVLTYIPPIAIGGVCLLVWRRLDALHVAGSPPPGTIVTPGSD
jgi:putative heme transporter